MDSTKEQKYYKIGKSNRIAIDLKCKEVMLAEIAYSNFINNNLFFQQGEIAKQIEEVLKEMLTDEQRINGRDVLRAIEEQHGILVNRYEDIYSFSHLTLQEFLTAKHIVDNNIDLTVLSKEHLCEKRWREVFLLVAGLRKADDLLLAMEQQIRTYMTTPKLQNLLLWVDKVSDPTPGDFQPLGKRAMAISNANAYAIANTYTIAYANANANANAYAIAIAYANANAYTYANVIAKAYANAIDFFVRYAKWSIEFGIYRGLDLQGAIDRSEQLKAEIPGDERPKEVHQAFARKLIDTWLAAFDLTPEMVDLSKAEIQALDNYLYAHLLLIECERAAVRRTPEVWSQIESRMLRLV